MPFSHIRFHVVECNASFSCKQIDMIDYGFFTVYYTLLSVYYVELQSTTKNCNKMLMRLPGI